MDKKFLKRGFLLVIIVCCFTSVSIYAATNIGGTVGIVEKNVCIPTGTTVVKDDGTTVSITGAYHIKYTSENSTMVDYNKLTFTDIVNGHVPYPDGVSESDKSKYQFDSEYYSNSCYVGSNGSVETCPSSSQISKYDIFNKFNNKNYSNYVTFVLNESNGKFDVYIKDAFKDKLYVRYISYGRALNENGKNSASSYLGEFLTRSNVNNGTEKFYGYKISNVDGSTDGKTLFLNLEFYIKDEEPCSNTYLGMIGIELPNANNYEISNPALANPDYYGCNLVKSYVPSGMSSSEINSNLTPLKQGYISECYNQKISYKDKDNLKNSIVTKFERLKSIFSNYTGNSDSSKLTCEQSHTKSKLTYSYTGNYWMMNCFENYTAEGDTAKLVSAGSGFEYQTKYSVTRTCSIYQISKPSKPPQCHYDCGHVCYWNEKSGVKSGTDGGPSDEFDSCISECDNGSYTQSCINSCYNKVYKSKRDLSFTDKFSYSDSEKSNVERLSSCTTNHNRPGESATGGCGENYCVSDFCNNHGGYCVSWSNVYPSGCVDDPDAVYNSSLAASKNELLKLIQTQESSINQGNYTYKIADSSLVTSGGKNYIYSVDSTNDPALNVSSNEKVVSKDTVTTALGNDGGESVSFNQSYTKRSDITVSLPLAYVSKVTGTAVYQTNENSNKNFYVDNSKNKLLTLSNFNKNSYYNAGHKYFTSIWSENLNVSVDCNNNTVNLFRQGDYNIKVASSNVGMGNFSSDIQCYYGVYNNYYKEKEDLCSCNNPPCPTSSPNPSPSSVGIQYIFRPINLTDMFPNNRNPRFNWTGTIDKSTNTATGAAILKEKSLYNDAVDPETLIKTIESKGESIYDVSNNSSEIDYEFVLTKENIRNIRSYNKHVRDYNGDGEKNYLDYNMSCYKNSRGQEVCTSKFLDNINGNSGSEENSNFITYSVGGYGMTERKSIAGCNNAINGTECDTISK